MKRSLLDPLPRPLSTKALVALVALVVAGTGVAVIRFLQSSPGLQRQPPAVHAAPEANPRILSPSADSLSRGTPRRSRPWTSGPERASSTTAPLGWSAAPEITAPGRPNGLPGTATLHRPGDDS